MNKSFVLGRGFLWYGHFAKAVGSQFPDAVQLLKTQPPIQVPEGIVCLKGAGDHGAWEYGELTFTPLKRRKVKA